MKNLYEIEFKEYKPSLDELLMIPMDHIQKVKDCFEACKSRDDVVKVIRAIPNMFGCFSVEFNTENEGFAVLNTYIDAEDEYYEEEYYWFDYPEDWDYCDDPDVDEELLEEYKKEGED